MIPHTCRTPGLRFAQIALSLLFTLCASRGEERLMARFTIAGQEIRDCLKTNANWSSIQLPNDSRLFVTETAGESVQYPLPESLRGFAGTIEVLAYKSRCETPLDTHAKLEIRHGNRSRTDSAALNFATDRDGWVSLGRFDFTGKGDEWVRISRDAAGAKGKTPAPMIRFDAYYDLQTRAQTNPEKAPFGYSETGAWQPTAEEGYRPGASPRHTQAAGATAIWNPGPMESGTIKIYARKPRVEANDRYEVFHNGKVETVYLKNLKQANLDLYNPVTLLGWYKLGEFEFDGRGGEYVKLTKTTQGVPSVADSMYFEKVHFDGTILHRTVVLPRAGARQFADSASISMEQKEARAKIPVGLSPQDKVSTSSKFGSTIYSRALWIKDPEAISFWNPCVTEPGEYELLYYLYWEPKKEGTFEILHNGKTDSVRLTKDRFAKNQFVSLGKFRFAGGNEDEFIKVSGIDRASDLTLEKRSSDGSVLKQVVTTAHPYFREVVYKDTKGRPDAHDISFMVQKGFVAPRSAEAFSPEEPMALDEFAEAARKMLGGALKGSYDLFYGIPAGSALTRAMAAQLLSNANEISGRYMNVVNLFQPEGGSALSNCKDVADIPDWAREGFERMVVSEVLPVPAQGAEPNRIVTRAEGTCLLKNFLEKILGSGPPQFCDWELTFHDEFNGTSVDWSKWVPEAMVRFKGLSAKWGENCVVEDGVMKGYNFMDYRGAPYSSGCLLTRFSQVHGFFEARYKYPDKAYGSHSSFWTSSSGGDFNYNEGTYPNGISMNNYFLSSKPVPGVNEGKSPRAHDFTIPTSFAADFHTISGFLDEKDCFCGLDGQVRYEIKDYPKYYATPQKTTNVPYALRMSTVITYFDGPLDRDRIDGSAMMVDWVRAYKKTRWTPKLDLARCVPQGGTSAALPRGKAVVLKFNKPVKPETILSSNIVVTRDGAPLPCKLTQITPLRVRIEFEQSPGADYRVEVKPTVTDLFGAPVAQPALLTFKGM